MSSEFILSSPKSERCFRFGLFYYFQIMVLDILRTLKCMSPVYRIIVYYRLLNMCLFVSSIVYAELYIARFLVMPVCADQELELHWKISMINSIANNLFGGVRSILV